MRRRRVSSRREAGDKDRRQRSFQRIASRVAGQVTAVERGWIAVSDGKGRPSQSRSSFPCRFGMRHHAAESRWLAQGAFQPDRPRRPPRRPSMIVSGSRDSFLDTSARWVTRDSPIQRPERTGKISCGGRSGQWVGLTSGLLVSSNRGMLPVGRPRVRQIPRGAFQRAPQESLARDAASICQHVKSMRGKWNGPFHRLPFIETERLPSRCK